MNKLKTSCLLLLLVYVFPCWGQTVDFKRENIIPPSPTVAAMAKYGQIPVDYSTGIPSINIPLYTLQCGTLTIPISLSYNAGGIRVDEAASWVGLGWTLNAGGTISSHVNGIQDAVYSPHYRAPLPEEIEANNYTFTFEQIEVDLYPRQYDSYHYGDLKPDIFTYSVGEHSGQFILGTSDNEKSGNNYMYQPYDISNNQSITFSPDVLSGGLGIQYNFNATDNKGWKYYFSNKEYATIAGQNSERFPYTAWHLSKMVSCDDVDSICFSYFGDIEREYKQVPNPMYYGQGGSESNKSWSHETRNLKYNSSGNDACIGNYSSEYANQISYRTQKLDSIRASNGFVVRFIKEASREDLYKPVSSTTRSSLLKSIIVYHISNPQVIIKKWDFEYEYFDSKFGSRYDSSTRYRLKLKCLKEYGNGEESPMLYTFDYYNELPTEAQMPYRHSYAGKDMWGYCNGQPSQSDSDNPKKAFYNFSGFSHNLFKSCVRGGSYKEENINLLVSYQQGWDGNVDSEMLKAYSLKRITYPTGGYTEFEYEPNHFECIDELWQNSDYYNYSMNGGGMRIHKITDNDGVHNTERVFEYSEGTLPEMPHFISRDRYQTFDLGLDLTPFSSAFEGDLTNYLSMYPYAINTLGLSKADNVMYPKVTECFPDGKRIDYQYTDINLNYDGIPSDESLPFYGYHAYPKCSHTGFAYNIKLNGRTNAASWADDVENDASIVNNQFYNGLYMLGGNIVHSNDYYNGYYGRVGTFFTRGHILRKAVYQGEDDSDIVSEEEYEYELSNRRTFPAMEIIRSLSPSLDGIVNGVRNNLFYINFYFYITGTYRLSNKTVTEYTRNFGDIQPICDYYEYEYNCYDLLTKTTRTRGNQTETAIVRYPSDINVGAYETMVNRNMLDYPIEQIHLIGDNSVISGSIQKYNGISPLPVAVYEYKPRVPNQNYTSYNGLSIPQCYGSPTVVINESHGNRIYSFTDKSGLRYNYSWDNYAVNIDKETILDAAGNTLQEHSFTHQYGVGLLSETKPNGEQTFYDYDSFNRLVHIYNSSGMLQNFRYNNKHR